MITVGIPTYNEEKVIAQCINSILPQLSKKDEVIVVASGCTDNTIPEIKKIMEKDKRVRLFVEQERRGKSSAINIIVNNAKSDIIVQTDGDVIVDKNALSSLLNHFSNKEVGAVSGNPIPILPRNNLFYEWTTMNYRKIHELREQQNKQGDFWHLSGYLCAFRKKAMKELPFAKGAVDALMAQIVKSAGYSITYEPNARVFVKTPTTVRDFVNQKARVRAGFYFLDKGFKERPRKMKSEIFYLPEELVKVRIEKWPTFLFSGFVYLYGWIKGWWFFKRNKSLDEIWKHVSSTK